ncbi:hypothetical protein WA588_003650, partial [Blastocystis sp. NMH]
SSIYSSQPKNVKDQSFEIVHQYYELTVLDSRLERLSSLSVIDSSDPSYLSELLNLYQQIEYHIAAGRGVVQTLCDRVCGFILRPFFIETGKREGSNPLIQYSGLQQRLSQVLVNLVREETLMKEETLSKECLWKSVWQSIIEAVILYSDTEDDANHNEANLITILQQTIPLLRKRSNFHFDDRVQELGFAEALRDLALKYESKDRFIRTKLMIVVRMVDDH